MRGLRLPEIAPHPVSEETETKMRLALESGEPQQVEALVRATGSGPQHGWSTSLTPLKDPAGRVRAVCLAAHHRLQEHLARQRMLLLSDAGTRIGTTPDSRRTAQELADVAVPRLADFAAVDLLEAPRHGHEPPRVPVKGPVTVTRTAVRSVLEDSPLSPPAAGEKTLYPALSPVAQCLAQGHGALYEESDAALARWAAQDPRAAWIRETGAHSVMFVPMRAHGAVLGVALFNRHRRRSPSNEDDLSLAEELAAARPSASTTPAATPASTPPPWPCSAACCRSACPTRRP